MKVTGNIYKHRDYHNDRVTIRTAADVPAVMSQPEHLAADDRAYMLQRPMGVWYEETPSMRHTYVLPELECKITYQPCTSLKAKLTTSFTTLTFSSHQGHHNMSEYVY